MNQYIFVLWDFSSTISLIFILFKGNLLNIKVKYKFSLIKMFYDIIWQATSLKRYDLHG